MVNPITDGGIDQGFGLGLLIAVFWAKSGNPEDAVDGTVGSEDWSRLSGIAFDECEVRRREELFGGWGGCVPCECEDLIVELALTEGIDDGATLFARCASDQECWKRHDEG